MHARPRRPGGHFLKIGALRFFFWKRGGFYFVSSDAFAKFFPQQSALLLLTLSSTDEARSSQHPYFQISLATPVIMADIARNAEDDSVESCIIVRQKELSHPRNSTPQKMPPPSKETPAKKTQPPVPAKRGRGRPRKPRNNTKDTAIVLSDDERDEGDPPQGPQSRERKRPSSTIESPTPGPSSKRSVLSHGSLGPFSQAAEIDRLRQELALEKKLLGDAEESNYQLQQALESRQASWAADMATQMVPLQLEVQTLATEKHNLEGICNDLRARLEEALRRNQGNRTSPDNPPSESPEMQTMEEELRCKEALINSQNAELEELREAEELRSKDLAEAIQKITILNKTVDDLTVRHTAATNRVHDHENRIAQLQRELFETKSFSSTASDSRRFPSETDKRLAQTEARLAAEQKKLSQAEDKLAKVEEQLGRIKNTKASGGGKGAKATEAQNTVVSLRAELQSCHEEVESLRQENINLKATISSREKDAQHLCAAAIAREQELGTREKAISALQRENQLLTAQNAHAGAENVALKRELDKQKEAAAALQREKEEIEKISAVNNKEVAALRREVEQHKSALENHQAKTREFVQSKVQAIDLEKELAEHKETIATLRREKEQMVDTYKRAIGERADLKDKIRKLTYREAAKDSELLKLRAKLANLEEATEKMRQAALALRADLHQLQREFKEKEELVAEKEREVERLRENLHPFKEKVTKLEEVTTHKSQGDNLHKLTAERDALSADHAREVERLQNNISTLTSECSRLKEMINANEMGCEEYLQNVEELEAAQATMDDTLKDTDAQITPLRQEVTALTAARDSLQEQLTTARAEIDRLQGRATDKVQMQVNDELAKSLANPKEENQALQTTNTLLAATNEQLSADLPAFNAKQGAVNLEHDQLEDQVNLQLGTLSNEHSQATNADVATLLRQTTALEFENAKLKESNTELLSKLHDAEVKLHENEAKPSTAQTNPQPDPDLLASIQAEKATLEAQNTALNAELHDLRARFAAAQSHIPAREDVATARARLTGLTTEDEELKNQRRAGAEEIKRLRAQVAETRREMAKMEHELEEKETVLGRVVEAVRGVAVPRFLRGRGPGDGVKGRDGAGGAKKCEG
ncbi:hypothetical protein VTI74DRAFT_8995 [Chaetomium olivicolor]